MMTAMLKTILRWRARSLLCAGLVALLTACGGGGSGADVIQTGGAQLAASSSVTWTKCADEWGTCSFTGTRQVRYGTTGLYASQTATSSIECTNAVFGDPAPTFAKTCEYSSDTTTPPPTVTWIKCANEWGTCSFTGTHQVRYGTSGLYAFQTATSSIECTNAVFGDPAPKLAKTCDYANDTTTPPPSTTPPIPAPVTSGSTTMSCVDGAGYQCSGQSILRTENGVALTSSGVQAYGKSTNDLATPIADPTTAFGLTLASGGVAELRVAKDGASVVSAPALLLSNLGISWTGTSERPRIIETFKTTAGFVKLDSTGVITTGSLPASSNLGYYDFASKGSAATQANYANNQYFPRSYPSRCPSYMVVCPTTETTGLRYLSGDWRTGGFIPDMAAADRVHEDGDVHAGDAGVDPVTHNPIYLSGASGPGVPFPGTKGDRHLVNWGLQYGNLGAWLTKDTVEIFEWGASNEHNQNRRGAIAYGAVSNPAIVPASGSATYAGFAYGWYAPSAIEEAIIFRGEATMTVNFVTRVVVVTIKNTIGYDWHTETYVIPVPVALTAPTAMGAAGGNVANYLTGPVDDSGFKGGLSGRYFGPVITSGTSGAGPAELGGTFSLSNAASGQAIVGGFIGRKQ